MPKVNWQRELEILKELIKKDGGNVDLACSHYNKTRGSILTICNTYGIPVNTRFKRAAAARSEGPDISPELIRKRNKVMLMQW